MSYLTIITLPKTMPLVERISEVSKQLSVWLESVESPFNLKTDVLELARYEQNEKKYIYYYTLHPVMWKAQKEARRHFSNLQTKGGRA